MKKKRIAILGATGSIGTQAVEIIREHPEQFEVTVLTGHSNVDLLLEQAIALRPAVVVISKHSAYNQLKESLAHLDIEVKAGEEALIEVVQREDVDLVLASIVGFAGLPSTLAAIRAGKELALANKETLVVAGALVMSEAKKYGVKILPVDSEHSAIFQCLQGEHPESIEKIILTASGGPFRGWKRDRLHAVTPAQALKHPNWEMGKKISVDSASLMNKGLEVIEAKWLFDLEADQIDVVVHPQSVIHSMVQFNDGSIKAQLGLPDMKLPIQYAFGYPLRIKNKAERFDFLNYPVFNFEAPDPKSFPNLALAYKSLTLGGNIPCALNAANEVAVESFLAERIGFLQMSDLISEVMAKTHFLGEPSWEDYLETDSRSRHLAEEIVTKQSNVHLI